MTAATEKQIIEEMREIGAAAKAAARVLATAPSAQKDEALQAAAADLRAREAAILKANEADVSEAAARLSGSFIDRLALDPARIGAMASGLKKVAAQSDPVGAEIASWSEPNGLKIRRVRTPIGVVGVIYESRPNVTADAGALTLKSGNAAILRGGSESFRTAGEIHAALVAGLEVAGLPAAAISRAPTRDRAAVGAMLEHMADQIDVIVPRGGRSLVERVQTTSRVPVFAHLEGICHIYAHRDADVEMARNIVVNAKMRRTGICGAAECLLVDKAAEGDLLQPLILALLDAGCEVRGDSATQSVDSRVKAASADDFGKEFLDAVIAVKVVDGYDAAVEHIRAYGSNHTDAILTSDEAVATAFYRDVDSAIVMWNASTQFADGGEFGMGAEIGIATGKLHARGPVGAEQLTSFKYLVEGGGSVRR